MSSKQPTNARNPKISTNTSIQVKDRSQTEQPILLGSRQPGHGVFVHSTSLKDSDTKFKISSGKPVQRQLSALDLVKIESQYKVKSSILEIVEKELGQTLSILEDRNQQTMLMQLDMDKMRETINELEEVG